MEVKFKNTSEKAQVSLPILNTGRLIIPPTQVKSASIMDLKKNWNVIVSSVKSVEVLSGEGDKDEKVDNPVSQESEPQKEEQKQEEPVQETKDPEPEPEKEPDPEPEPETQKEEQTEGETETPQEEAVEEPAPKRGRRKS